MARLQECPLGPQKPPLTQVYKKEASGGQGPPKQSNHMACCSLPRLPVSSSVLCLVVIAHQKQAQKELVSCPGSYRAKTQT